MGFLQLLRFALLCVDFLAWPAIALGYPLFASVRAIETGSKYHLRKLVVYWTLFSLISLFESTFVKIIEWIPFWSSVKLLTMVWLVFPRFHGACYAYRSFVRPYLVANLQEVIGVVVYKPKEEAEERFLDVADKYIKENGYEKLIAGKDSYMTILNEADNSQIGKNVTAASKQVEEAGEKGKERLEELYMISSPEAKQVPHPRLLTTVSAKTKDAVITPPPPENEQQLATATLQKSEVGWGCHICQVTMTCEKNLNDHLLGKKHKSKVESLNARNHLDATDNDSVEKNVVGDGSKFELRCDVCELKLLSEVDVGTHLRGKRHASNLKRLDKVQDVKQQSVGVQKVVNCC